MLLVLITVLYAFTAVIQTPDVWFCTGMVLLLTFTFSYAFEPEACIDTDMGNTAGTATQAGTSQVNTQKKANCPAEGVCTSFVLYPVSFCVVYGWLYSIAGACL